MKPIPDMTPIMRHARAIHQTRLLIAATHHLDVFEQFADGPKSLQELQRQTGLQERPAMVLFPALCAMNLLRYDPVSGKFSLTEEGRHLVRASDPNLLGYLQFQADDPGVLEMAERLRHDGPSNASAKGMDYIKEGDGPSPMDDPETARMLTLRLAGRAQLLSPLTAAALPKGKKRLLDVAGGSGFYSYEWLWANPDGIATVFDRPEVLRVAKECLEIFCEKNPAAKGIKTRIHFHEGDMLVDEFPPADVLLTFSLFHDWPTETCARLSKRFADALNPQGEIWVHDEFLNDAWDGPLETVAYSAHLFQITKGRIYTRQEHYEWFQNAGLEISDVRIPTSMSYSLISARKP